MSEYDLPPPGTRSLFDHLVNENGGLPFPFEKLMDLVAEYGEGGAPPVTLLVPDGRSLVRADVDHRFPRSLLAANALRPVSNRGDLGLPLRNRLFVGYSETLRQLEVISYNEGAGRFEFQLVDDYAAGRAPRIGYARRALCLTCHQNGTPIFPIRPWDETNVNASVARAIREARGTGPGARYRGVPIENPLRAAEEFDALTDNAAHMLTAQRVWREGCGAPGPEGIDCRRLLLTEALRFAWNPGLYRPDSAAHRRLVAAQGDRWPEGGIGVPNTDIPNRAPPDPAAGKGARSLLDWLGLASGDGRDISDLPPALNPATPRPPRRMLSARTGDGVYGLSRFFTSHDVERLKRAGGFDFQRLAETMEGADFAAILGPGPMRRVPIVKALLRGLGADPVPGSCCESDDKMLPPALAGAKPVKLAEGSDLEPFRRYCFSCHRGNPTRWLDFMAGDDEGTIWRRMADARNMLDVLDWDGKLGTGLEYKLMPPRDSIQGNRLEAALAEGRDDLSAIRKALLSRGW